MKFYFNCNNMTQAKALLECGVKNVLLSYQYNKKNFEDIAKMFKHTAVIAGKIKNVDDYYSWVDEHKWEADFFTQYDVPMNMDITIKYWEKLSNIVAPVLTVNYLQHLSRLSLNEGRTVVLGKMGGNIEEDEQLRKLPSQYFYHGLAKGRWKDRSISSINSSTWLSGVRNRKTDVWDTQSVEFGDKGRGDVTTLQHAIGKYSEYLKECHIEEKSLLLGEYSALLKAPIALYYKPMLSALGFSSENFL